MLSAPPMYRRLAGMLYDFLIGGAVASIMATIIIGILMLKDVTVPANSLLSYSIFALELFVGFFYFQWFILHKGQSLGMQVWKIKITDIHGNAVTYPRIAIRYLSLTGLMLAGFLTGYKVLSYSSTASIGIALLFLLTSLLWSYTNKRKQALHEVLSSTRLLDCR